MASSKPIIKRVSLPSEVPPSNTFTFEVSVRQESGPDPWGSSGQCTSKNGDITAWVTPITVWVDGSRRETQELCLANGNERSTQFSLSLTPGSHNVEVQVHQVGDNVPLGESWEDNLAGTVRDDVTATVETSTDARDPSRQTSTGKLLDFVNSVADALGTSVNMIAVGVVAAAILFLVI